MLNLRKFVEYADRGHVSSILQQNWVNRTGYNPVMLAKEHLHQESQCRVGFVYGFGSLVFGILWVLASMIMRSFDVSWSGSVNVAGFVFTCFGVLCFFMVLKNWLKLNKLWQEIPVTSSHYYFLECLYYFCKWTRYSLWEFHLLNQSELRELAELALVRKAVEILKLQDRNKDKPEELWLDRKEELLYGFDLRYRVLSDLGIVGGPYGRFFDVAREKLEEEKKASAKFIPPNSCSGV